MDTEPNITNTSGGANVSGDIDVEGNFVGRDLIQGDSPTVINIHANQINIPTSSSFRTPYSTISNLSLIRFSYLGCLIERNKYLDPRGTFQVQRQVQLRLDEVYISLQAQPEYAPGKADYRSFEREISILEKQGVLTKIPDEEIEDRREQIITRFESFNAQKTITTPAISLHDAIAQHSRLIILGDPGCGKTTLLKYLAYQHANALHQNIPAGQKHPNMDLGYVCFPIYVRIADYAENQTWKARSLSDFLAESCLLSECPDEGLAALFQEELAAGNCLILFDGLDEVVEADDRRSIVQKIEDFTRRYALGGERGKNNFVITSRLAGYRSAPLGEPFAHFVVCEMDDEQIHLFLERWCTAVEDAQTPDLSNTLKKHNAQREIDGIFNAVRANPGVRRLATNPLMLRTLALIHRTGAQLPQRRIELYRLATETLAHTWRTAQGVPESVLVDERNITRLLGKMAYWLHENKSTGTATEREVFNVLGEEWARINRIIWDEQDPHPAIENEISKFLLSVREHTGIFVERAPKRYGFMHLTFEEYYTARHLVARRRDAAVMIRQHLHNARWTEPILLALGFVGLDYPDEAAELFETAILAQGSEADEFNFRQSDYEQLLRQDFLFGLRCLGDRIPVDRNLSRNLLERLVSELIQIGYSSTDILPLCFPQYQQALWERLSYLEGNEDLEEILVFQFRKALQLETEHNIRLGVEESNAAFLFEIIGRVSRTSTTLKKRLIDVFHLIQFESRENFISLLGRFTNEQPLALDVLISLLQNSEDNLYLNKLIERTLSKATITSNVLDIDIGDLDELVGGIYQDHRENITVDDEAKLSSIILGALPKLFSVELSQDTLEAMTDSIHKGMPSKLVVEAILQKLKHNSPEIRRIASAFLLLITPTSFAEEKLLFEMLKDSDKTVRQFVAISLGKSGIMTPLIQSILIEALVDSPIRWEAANLLGRLGAPDDSLLLNLIEGLINNDQNIATACIESFISLSRRFPSIVPRVCLQLQDVINDFASRAIPRSSISDLNKAEHAYSVLWMLLMT